MTKYHQSVIQLLNEAKMKHFHQLTRDIIEDHVSPVVMSDDTNIIFSHSEVGAIAYDLQCFIDIFNPAFQAELLFLTNLRVALSEWARDLQQISKTLGGK